VTTLPSLSVNVADNFDLLGKVVCFWGQLKNISYENRKPQFREINYSFVRRGGADSSVELETPSQFQSDVIPWHHMR
jgi:hypothetical protein